MGTVSKSIADAIVAGVYDSDKPLTITEYTDVWGGINYGVTFEGENPDRYKASEHVINPKPYWCRAVLCKAT